MNKYETVILLDSKLSEEEREETLLKVKEYISSNGTIEKEESLGLKKLAYEIRKNTHAYYYIIEFESEATAINELERLYRIIDAIIKFIVIKRDE